MRSDLCKLLSGHLYPRLLQTWKKFPGKTLGYKDPISTCGFTLTLPFLELEGSLHERYSYINPQELLKCKFPFSLQLPCIGGILTPKQKPPAAICCLLSTISLPPLGMRSFQPLPTAACVPAHLTLPAKSQWIWKKKD